jgi:hypothetical protein
MTAPAKQPTEMNMYKHPQFSRLFSQMMLLTGLVLAFYKVFAADFPIGSYRVDGAKATLTFDAKGQFRVQEGQKMQVAGKYTVNGDRIEFTDKEGPWACTKDGAETGSYHWNYEKSALSFSKLADACEDRVSSLATVKWKQQH